jgi:peptide/nickel transport system permease protein
MVAARGLRAYVIQRLLLAVPMLLILLTFVFVLLRVAPGDPVLAIAPQGASEETIERRRAELGLDRPLWEQYLDYLADLVKGDLGYSAQRPGVPVFKIISDSFPATLELTFFAMLVAIGVGVPLGALAGARRGGWLDLAARLFGILIYSAPIFWLGIMAILVFSSQLHWLPSGGRAGLNPPEAVTNVYTLDSIITLNFAALADVLEHLILPATTLGLVIAGIFLRITRVNMLQTMAADYVEAARARGIPERLVVFRHGLKNALVPVVTIVGLTFALLLGGAVLTENVFNWPGLARTLTIALTQRDYPVVQGITVFFALVIVAVSLVIDVLNAFIDPRIRY